MSTKASAHVTGEVHIGPEIPSCADARVHIYLEEVGRLDAPAVRLAEQTIADVHHHAGAEDRLAFSLEAPPPDEKADYTVRVHVALHGDRDVRRGDLVTTQSYPVLTRGHPNRVNVRVSRVG